MAEELCGAQHPEDPERTCIVPLSDHTAVHNAGTGIRAWYDNDEKAKRIAQARMKGTDKKPGTGVRAVADEVRRRQDEEKPTPVPLEPTPVPLGPTEDPPLGPQTTGHPLYPNFPVMSR